MLELEKTYLKRTRCPAKGSDPFYYHIYKSTLPLERAYRLVHPKRNQVTTDIAHFKLKGYKKRQIYIGYNNWTALEKEWMVKVKDELRLNHNIDLDIIKPFGPRTTNGFVTEGETKVIPGVDPMWEEYMLLKYIVAYKFDMAEIVKNMIYHLEWR